MKLKVYKSLWGMDHLPLEQQLKLVSEAGYAGFESPVPSQSDEPLFRELVERYGLEYCFTVYTSGDHKDSFKQQVDRALTFSPMLINAHSAKDDMPYEQQLEFYRYALDVEKSADIPIVHETHRGRALFTPWSAERLLKDLPDLNICADFSHWCCVCESLLEDQVSRMKIATERARFVHARVGHQEGPQVNHPAAPEHAAALAAHTAWWRDIARNRRDQGAEYLILVPEFGPPGYLQTAPFSQEPVSDLWEVCLWMKNHLESQWDGWLA